MKISVAKKSHSPKSKWKLRYHYKVFKPKENHDVVLKAWFYRTCVRWSVFLCFRASTRVVRSDFRACLRGEWWVTSRD